jgi:hypothetical protein
MEYVYPCTNKSKSRLAKAFANEAVIIILLYGIVVD